METLLKVIGIVFLVVLVLVGALMPLKYTARMGLPRKRPSAQPDRADEDHADEGPGA